MADEFITVPVETDPLALRTLGTDYIQEQVPGWEVNEASAIVRALGAISRIGSELMTLLSDVPPDIFRYFGAKLIGLMPIASASATMPTTWTLTDDLGHTIEAGTTIGGRDEGGNLVTFIVEADVIVPAGQTATGVGAVVVRATSEGEDGNNIDDPLEVVDSASFVLSVEATAPSSGGADAETNEEYQDRLAAELELMSPRPILPPDFAIMARRIGGVERAVAIDGYNPVGPLFDQERTVAVAAVDEDGEAVGAGVKTDIDELLQEEREVNFIVNVIDPTYTIIDVTFTVRTYPGQDLAAVEAEAEAAVTSYLEPFNWGRQNNPQGRTSQWEQETTLRWAELATLLNNIPSVYYVQDLEFAKQGNPLDVVDVVLDGPAPISRPGVISGTAVAP